MMIWLLVGIFVGLPGGWFLKSKFGAQVTAVKNAVDHHPV